MPSLLEQYRVADLLEWHRTKRLELNPEFQRGSVWTPAARSYLVDTVLRGLPIPKVFMRTRIDVSTKQTIREVVDGQQRLRAILDFASDRLMLTARAGEYAGKRFSDLEEEQQEHFLGYPIAVDQLLNASDEDVLEVFSRINAYSLPLNPAEKRHATHNGDLKWAVRSASRDWAVLWEDYGIISTRQRVRMQDDSLIAEMFGVLLEGVRDGGQPKIDQLYKRHDARFGDRREPVRANLDLILHTLVPEVLDPVRNTAILGAPHFLMLFSACAHALVGIPKGDLAGLPARPTRPWSPPEGTGDRLQALAAALEADESPPSFLEAFRAASRSSTQRIGSRRVRFPFYWWGITGHEDVLAS